MSGEGQSNSGRNDRLCQVFESVSHCFLKLSVETIHKKVCVLAMISRSSSSVSFLAIMTLEPEQLVSDYRQRGVREQVCVFGTDPTTISLCKFSCRHDLREKTNQRN